MKKIFLLFLLFTQLLQSSQVDYEAEIYKTIFSALFPTKRRLYVWSNSQKERNMLKRVPQVLLVKDINRADIILLTKDLKVPQNTPLFVNNYRLFQKRKKEIIGAFYWQKGRPNIRFYQHNLDKFHLLLPNSMSQYIEE